MRIKKINNEVYHSDENIVKVNKNIIEILKKKAKQSPRKRVRLCAHQDIKDPLHEMLIVLSKDTYVRPHKHLRKSESFHVIEGKGKVLLFDERGNIESTIDLSEYGKEGNFYYRLDTPKYHTVIVESDSLIIHEVTNGPFDKSDADFAEWSPEDDDFESQKTYMKKLKKTDRISMVKKR